MPDRVEEFGDSTLTVDTMLNLGSCRVRNVSPRARRLSSNFGNILHRDYEGRMRACGEPESNAKLKGMKHDIF